jgi:hypothetical protein
MFRIGSIAIAAVSRIEQATTMCHDGCGLPMELDDTARLSKDRLPPLDVIRRPPEQYCVPVMTPECIQRFNAYYGEQQRPWARDEI